MAVLHARILCRSLSYLFLGYFVINAVSANNVTSGTNLANNNIYVSSAPNNPSGIATTASQNLISMGAKSTTTTVKPVVTTTKAAMTKSTTTKPTTTTSTMSPTKTSPVTTTVSAEIGQQENGCMTGITLCKTQHTPLAYDGIPDKVLSPQEFTTHCTTRSYGKCLGTVKKTDCTKYEQLTLEGYQKAETYVCSVDAIKLYGQKNEFNDHPWENLKKYYMPKENSMCKEDFMLPSFKYMEEYEKYISEKKEVQDKMAALEALPDESVPNKGDQLKDLSQKDTNLKTKANKEREHYCNYMYVYQECIELAVKRHCNNTVADWQYQVLSQHFTPHFEYMGCQIGKGMKPLHISAIVIVSVILGLIFALALFCGVYEKCFEKIKICRRRSNSAEDLEALANDDKRRQNVMVPGENGLPQRTGSSSKVRFDSKDDVRKMSA